MGSGSNICVHDYTLLYHYVIRQFTIRGCHSASYCQNFYILDIGVVRQLPQYFTSVLTMLYVRK